MSFLIELSTMLKRAGITVPEDFIIFDNGSDRINLQSLKLIDFMDRFGLTLNKKDIKINPEKDSIEFIATPQIMGFKINDVFDKILNELEGNLYVDYFDFNTEKGTFRIDFIKEVEIY